MSATPPGDGQVQLGEAGLEQDRGPGTPLEGDDDGFLLDVDVSGRVDELLMYGLGGRVLVALQAAGQQAVDAAGDHGQGGVHVHVEGQARGQGVHLEALDVGGQLVFDEHPLGVAGEEVPGLGGCVIGDKQGRLVPADVAYGDLAC